MAENREIGELACAVTGASGSIYAQRFLAACVGRVEGVHLVITDTGQKVVALELETTEDRCVEALVPSGLDVQLHDNDDLTSRLASGSSPWRGMVVVPCSMGTLGRIASGVSGDLIGRAADVALKERRPLILVPREAPLNLVHVENMRRLILAGAHIIPASPGFYSKPQTIEQLVDFIVQRIFDALGVHLDLVQRWSEQTD